MERAKELTFTAEYYKSAKLLIKAKEIWKILLEPEHLETVTVYGLLAFVYKEHG